MGTTAYASTTDIPRVHDGPETLQNTTTIACPPHNAYSGISPGLATPIAPPRATLLPSGNIASNSFKRYAEEAFDIPAGLSSPAIIASQETESLSPHQIYSAITVTISPFIYGYILSTATLLKKEFDTRPKGGSAWLFRSANACIFGGALAANALDSLMTAERLSLLVLSNVFFFAGALLSLAPWPNAVLAGRFATGMASGMVVNAAPCYLGALAPVTLRGTVTSFYTVGTVSGLIAGACATAAGARLSTAITFVAVLAAAQMFALRFCAQLRAVPGKRGSLLALVQMRAAWRSLRIITAAHFAQHFAGINHIIFCAHSVFHTNDPSRLLILFYVTALVVSLFSSAVIEKFGRRSMLLFSTLVVALSCTAFYYALHPRFFSIVYVIGYNMGLANIPFILIGELFPEPYIPQGAQFGTLCNWLAGLLSSLVPMEKDNDTSFLVYIACMAAFWFLVLGTFKETRGRLPNFQ